MLVIQLMALIYMGMNRLLFVMWMSGMLFLSSCSIKEDRDVCPCWMTVDLSDVAESRWKSPEVQSNIEHQDVTKSLESRQHIAESVVLRLRGNSDEDEVDYAFKMTETVNTEVGALEYEVPRGAVGVSAVALGRDFSTPLRSARNDRLQSGNYGDEIRIPVGEQMDSLYGFFKMYHTRCESVRSEVKLHKEFCTVSFTLVDEHYESPYDIEVRGNVSGVSPWDLVPVSGAFKYAPVAEEGVYRVRVPRQVDASLEMVMLSNQEIVSRFPLGEYIIRSGYDWAAKDLSDVSVALDLEKQQVMVTVSGWDGVVMMDIVI